MEGEVAYWTLHTDRASNKEGLGAGLILKSPNVDKVTYGPHFDFQRSNNEAENEAPFSRNALSKRDRSKNSGRFTRLLAGRKLFQRIL
uniref:Reverse transcriptase RNase H-like domain-containing protein n=1 Tax=Lactuca sativa TaxID=4236 RepID=A0A9R1XF41_LACSA|nr:hypothetical protein LSAT_V11C400207960 [Lactuca sativa]